MRKFALAALSSAACLGLFASHTTWAQTAIGAPGLKLTLAGMTAIAYSPGRDGCDGNDVPDAPLRAYRDSKGQIVAFGLHYVNRRLRGPTLNALKIDCHVVLNSGKNANPAAYNDYNWITATWTGDGKTIAALVHHEYHGNEHKGRCTYKTMLRCWMNTVTAYTSSDSGRNFARVSRGFVVASTPFTQKQHQGRHRGFFNPSNIVTRGRSKYFFASTTGWQGQPHGVCLFRNTNPHKANRWRAFDGSSFKIRYRDPHRRHKKAAGACKPIAPFPAPVGSVTRHRPSGLWLAVFQAAPDKKYFPLSGFYFATSQDLMSWSTPRLLIPGKTLYDNPCSSGGRIISYPSLLDPGSKGRNFDNTGNSATLYYASMKVVGCTVTSNRDLISQKIMIRKSR